MKEELNLSKQELIDRLFHEDKNISNIFKSASDLNELREKLSFASLYGGILIANSGLSLCHCIAAAITLPYVLKYNSSVCSEKTNTVFDLFGGFDNLISLFRRIGIPGNLAELGIKKEDIPQISEKIA